MTYLHMIDAVEDLGGGAPPESGVAGAALPVDGGVPARPPRRRQRYRHLLLGQLHTGAEI